MSEETDRYYGEGYESGAQDLHKWMRRAENAEARDEWYASGDMFEDPIAALANLLPQSETFEKHE